MIPRTYTGNNKAGSFIYIITHFHFRCLFSFPQSRVCPKPTHALRRKFLHVYFNLSYLFYVFMFMYEYVLFMTRSAKNCSAHMIDLTFPSTLRKNNMGESETEDWCQKKWYEVKCERHASENWYEIVIRQYSLYLIHVGKQTKDWVVFTPVFHLLHIM